MKNTRDWQKIRLEFVSDPQKPSLRDFCVTRKVPYGTAKNYSSREDWMQARDQHWKNVTKKASPMLEDAQAVVFARDVAQKLTWIDEVKTIGLELAKRINLETANVGYGEIVTALGKLEKLERLILGESTEIINVEAATAMVNSIIDAVLEEVRDDGDRSRLMDRLERIGTAGSMDNQGGLN
jgi:hypothetical protein